MLGIKWANQIHCIPTNTSWTIWQFHQQLKKHKNHLFSPLFRFFIVCISSYQIVVINITERQVVQAKWHHVLIQKFIDKNKYIEVNWQIIRVSTKTFTTSARYLNPDPVVVCSISTFMFLFQNTFFVLCPDWLKLFYMET